MQIRTQRNYLAEEATLLGETIQESRAITATGGGDFMGHGALSAARKRAEEAKEWMSRHPEASKYASPKKIGHPPLNELACALLRKGAHISEVRHMVTH